jgi:hypothetical protein
MSGFFHARNRLSSATASAGYLLVFGTKIVNRAITEKIAIR